MNFFKKSLIIMFLVIILIYTVNITSIPNTVILFENEELNLGQTFGLFVKEEQKDTVETLSSSNKIESKTITLSLFNVLDVKKVEVSTIKNTKVIPLGNTIGIRLYSDGVLVIGMTEIEGKKPYQNTGIKEGDLITKVDNIDVSTTNELIECVNNSNGNNLKIKYLRDGIEHTAQIEPVKTKENTYKLRPLGKRWCSWNRYSNIL